MNVGSVMHGMTHDDLEVVFRSDRKKACAEAHLVLTSVGVTAGVRRQENDWVVVVSSGEAARALDELASFRAENPTTPTPPPLPEPHYRGAWPAALVYALVILGFAGLTSADQEPTLRLLGQMRAARVTSGEWWRVVTALTLHVDAGHVVSNVVFGGLFGVLAGRALGGGVAWLVILFAGALGNGVNAAVQPPEHVSIGASTAVFAALAILVAHALHPRRAAPGGRMRRWSPLIGGLVLFGLTGVGGERTDVIAHVTGFLAGLLLGWIGCRLPSRWLERSAVQWAAGLAALGVVALAWRSAIGG